MRATEFDGDEWIYTYRKIAMDGFLLIGVTARLIGECLRAKNFFFLGSKIDQVKRIYFKFCNQQSVSPRITSNIVESK